MRHLNAIRNGLAAPEPLLGLSVSQLVDANSDEEVTQDNLDISETVTPIRRSDESGEFGPRMLSPGCRHQRYLPSLLDGYHWRVAVGLLQLPRVPRETAKR